MFSLLNFLYNAIHKAPFFFSFYIYKYIFAHYQSQNRVNTKTLSSPRRRRRRLRPPRLPPPPPTKPARMDRAGPVPAARAVDRTGPGSGPARSVDRGGAHVDVHVLFCHYNALYFHDSLGACAVSWSSSPLPRSPIFSLSPPLPRVSRVSRFRRNR